MFGNWALNRFKAEVDMTHRHRCRPATAQSISACVNLSIHIW